MLLFESVISLVFWLIGFTKSQYFSGARCKYRRLWCELLILPLDLVWQVSWESVVVCDLVLWVHIFPVSSLSKDIGVCLVLWLLRGDYFLLVLFGVDHVSWFIRFWVSMGLCGCHFCILLCRQWFSFGFSMEATCICSSIHPMVLVHVRKLAKRNAWGWSGPSELLKNWKKSGEYAGTSFT